mgnify:CR=1 FL=1
MNPSSFEHYKFYRLYDIDLDSALHTLNILRRYKRPDIRNVLLRDIIITYARPFSGNKGNNIPKHTLTLKFVPLEQRNLHAELMNLRKQLFAHTDLTYRNPRIANWSSEKRRWFPMSFRGYDYGSLNKRIDDITNLISSVHYELRKRIREIENNF